VAEEFAARQPDQEHQGPDNHRLVDGHSVTGRPHGTVHGCRSPRHSPGETPRSEPPREAVPRRHRMPGTVARGAPPGQSTGQTP
jgi:hypothetical protein